MRDLAGLSSLDLKLYINGITWHCVFSGAAEYCENEMFRATCSPTDEVVIMKTAQYGRMKLSRCIDRDYGYVGCKSDVLAQAHRKCSGLRSCEVSVPNPEFSSQNSCPRDLKPYFEAEYTCLKGESVSEAKTRLKLPSGII